MNRVAGLLGPGPHLDFNAFMSEVETDADKHSINLTAKRRKLLQSRLGKRDETSVEVINKIHKPGKAEPDPLRGLFETTIDGSDLRDTA